MKGTMRNSRSNENKSSESSQGSVSQSPGDSYAMGMDTSLTDEGGDGGGVNSKGERNDPQNQDDDNIYNDSGRSFDDGGDDDSAGDGHNDGRVEDNSVNESDCTGNQAVLPERNGSGDDEEMLDEEHTERPRIIRWHVVAPLLQKQAANKRPCNDSNGSDPVINGK
jgi:hypothetical protein